MGNVCSCTKHSFGSSREITLLMIGLDNAGKTSTVKHLLGEPTSDAVPTIGFSAIPLRHGKFKITIYDLGGSPKIRGIWKKYYALVYGLIFVVDASNLQRLEECKREIQDVLKHDKIAGKPMLMLVNKQDVSGAVDETELVSRLDLEVLVNEQKCPTRVEASCALFDETKIKDPGIQEGFGWLIGIISRDFSELHHRVQREINEQRKEEEKEQAERVKRVQKLREERENRESAECKVERIHDDDDDVIIGNPFKSCEVIRAELNERENLKNQCPSTPTVKVIHVSPTNSSEEKNREEIIFHPVPLKLPLTNQREDIEISPIVPLSDMRNGNASSIVLDDEDSRKKNKKSKKRFKNRVVPDVSESIDLNRTSLLGDLPPLKQNIESVPNGQPCVYISPKRNFYQNGKIDWALAEELTPCKETSLSGSANKKRFEAWSEP